jgi:hypothetical protein
MVFRRRIARDTNPADLLVLSYDLCALLRTQ